MKRLIAFFLCCASVWATISANTVWEVRNAGSDTNGGAFVTGASGTNMSLFANKNAASCTSCQSATVNISTTDGVTAGSTTITSVTGNYSSALIGNLVYITGGTGSITAAWYQVLTVPGATSFTVDRSTGLTTGTGATINIGGALGSPGQAAANMNPSGQIAYVLTGSTYSITSTANNGSGACLGAASTASFVGYSTNRVIGNTDAAPTIQIGVNSGKIACTNNVQYFNFIFDGNQANFTATQLGASGAQVQYWNSTIKNFSAATSGQARYVGCQITTNSAATISGSVQGSEIFSNTATPFVSGTVTTVERSLIYNNSGASTDGTAGANGSFFGATISYGNGRDNFALAANGTFINCHSENAGRYGYNAPGGCSLLNCSNYNAGTGAVNGGPVQVGFLNPISSVFVAAGSNNFALNNTASAGALLRNAAYPGLLPTGVTHNYADIGAVQHQVIVGGVSAEFNRRLDRMLAFWNSYNPDAPDPKMAWTMGLSFVGLVAGMVVLARRRG